MSWRRVWKYAKAFQNYRRTITNKLRQAYEKKQREVADSAARASAHEGVAVSAADGVQVQPGDPTWTPEDMDDFLATYVTYESQVEHRRKVLDQRRQDPRHRDRGKPMPMLIKASDVMLFRICPSRAAMSMSHHARIL